MVSRADVLRWTREGWADNATLGDMQNTRELFSAMATSWSAISPTAWRSPISGACRSSNAARTVVGLVARRDLLRVRAHVIREERERRRLLRIA